MVERITGRSEILDGARFEPATNGSTVRPSRGIGFQDSADNYRNLRYIHSLSYDHGAVLMDPRVERAAQPFIQRVPAQLPVRGAFLFGSHSRGAQRPSSDVDIAVVLEGPVGHRVEQALAMADIAFDLMLETDLLIEALPIWEHEWEHPEMLPQSGADREHPSRWRSVVPPAEKACWAVERAAAFVEAVRAKSDRSAP